VLDVVGKLVHRAYVQENEYTINADDFENGVYFLQILTEKGIQVRKIQILK